MSETELLLELQDRLNEHMQLVEDILDEIRTDLQWGIRNDRIRIVSFSIDPCADDFKVNSIPRQTVDKLREALSQRTLFGDD